MCVYVCVCVCIFSLALALSLSLSLCHSNCACVCVCVCVFVRVCAQYTNTGKLCVTVSTCLYRCSCSVLPNLSDRPGFISSARLKRLLQLVRGRVASSASSPSSDAQNQDILVLV